jgi:WXG100 family type VII secretion target
MSDSGGSAAVGDSPRPLPPQNPAPAGSGGSGSGSVLEVETIDGKLVSGHRTVDGGFISTDGTVYVDPAGKAEFGITDPTTGTFLPGGTSRVIDGQTVYGTVLDGTFLSEDGTLLELPSGVVEHGRTDASGNFLAVVTVDGKEVWGSYGSDGSFLSEDGTTYVSPTGEVETGIVDPVSGQFLPNGSTRLIDGRTVYGSVLSDGSFISEDGTLLELPSGFVEHGRTDASGNFLAVVTVDGKQVWGSYGSDGSFLSEDGTMYIPPNGGTPEYGVTDPETASFLPGGTTYTEPDGKVLFGYADAGGFWSYDGSTIVLSDGTVVTGSINKGDGVFTGDNGQDYLVGQNGIQTVTPNPDGSFTISGGGGTVETPGSWQVELEAFTAAQSAIGADIQTISDAYGTIQNQYALIESFWTSPAGTTFEEATSAVDLAMNRLNTVLESITAAIQTAYGNYQAAEQQTIADFRAAGLPSA